MTLQEKCELLKKGLENLEYIDTEINGMEWQQITPSHNFVMLFYDYYELREKPKAKEIFVNVYDDNSIEVFDTLKESVYRKEWGVIKRFKGINCSRKVRNESKSWNLTIYSDGDMYIYYGDDLRYEIDKNPTKKDSIKNYYILELLYDSEQEKQYPCRECGVLRTKAEGGTVFTVCDECWGKLHNTPEIPNSVLKDYLPPEKPKEIELLPRLQIIYDNEIKAILFNNREQIIELTEAVNKLMEEK